jgi:hypothetical protein
MSKQAAPGTISAEKLRALTGYTDRHHRDLANQGYYPQPDHGQYQATATLAGLFKYLREQLSKKNAGAAQAEERLKVAKADMAEEELAAFRKKYVLKTDIGPALTNLANHQRATLQYKLEQEVAPNLAGKKPLEILTTMQNAVDNICQIFEHGIRGWLEDPAPAAEPQRGSVTQPRVAPLPSRGATLGKRPKNKTEP